MTGGWEMLREARRRVHSLGSLLPVVQVRPKIVYSRDQRNKLFVTPWEFCSDEASSPSHCDFGKEQKAGGEAARVYVR